jgi:hypothetical protein
MITKNGKYKCDSCGSFIGSGDKKAVKFTPYGSTTDFEPPNEEHECGKCVSKWSDWHKSYHETQTWITPSLIFNDKNE